MYVFLANSLLHDMMTFINRSRMQFPMSEYIKDPSAPEGWRSISHDKELLRLDSDNLNADAMDEGRDDGISDMEPDGEK